MWSSSVVENPSPDTYRLYSDFELNPRSSLGKSKAFSFGISREAYDKVYIPSQKVPSDVGQLPGPGQYTLLTQIGKEGRKYSLQGRTPYYKDTVFLSKKQAIPGPGSYDPKSSIDKFGIYYLSNIP